MPRFVRISRCPKIHDFTLTSGERDGTRTRRQERAMSQTNRLPDVVSRQPVHPRIPSPSPPRLLTFQPMHLDKWHLWEKIARDNSPSDRPSAKGEEIGVSRSSVRTCKQPNSLPRTCSNSPREESLTSYLAMKFPGALEEDTSKDSLELSTLGSFRDQKASGTRNLFSSHRTVLPLS